MLQNNCEPPLKEIPQMEWNFYFKQDHLKPYAATKHNSPLGK